MAPAPKLKSRYEIRERLPKQGAMGVVYKAWDLELRRFVAVKTIGDARNRAAIDQFRQECGVLASIAHANIVDIYDIGEMEEGGQQKPFFVMPFLPGQTLEQQMAGRALPVDRVVEIISQVCRGLQAAHERSVVHRDLKPSNIFVDDAGSVKIIDFGIARLVDNSASIGLKGTLLYMSPEQIQMKTASAASDVFSLAVVTYEALTGRRPFDGATQEEIAYRILRHVPPPVSELNPAANAALSQVVHAAMAKESRHRFSTAREFAEALQKALHNRPIERFDPARVEPRIQKAQKALEAAQFDFAADLVNELEAEGHLHPEIRVLRGRIDQALRDRQFRELLEGARRCFDAEEYALAMQKVQAVLDQQPDHAEARALSFQVEEKWNAQQRGEWMRLAREHLENQLFSQAREALDNVLKLRPTDTQALQTMAEVSRAEDQYLRGRRENAELFQAAQDAFARGEISSALYKAALVLERDRQMPDKTSPELGQAHVSFYNQVSSEHENIRKGLDEANRLLAGQDFQGAASLCDAVLARYPQDAQFRALRIDIDQKQRQHRSATIARIDRELDAEPDLNRRVEILEQALKEWPETGHFQRALQANTEKRDLVNSIAKKALALEERGQFSEAISQWETLRAIYPGYPGLDLEIERAAHRKDAQQRADSRNRILADVERLIGLGNYSDAVQAAADGLAQFPDDPELTGLRQTAIDRRRKADEASLLLEEGQRLFSSDPATALEKVAGAYQLDRGSLVIRAVLVDFLTRRAAALQETEPVRATEFVRKALELDPSNGPARNLSTLLADRRRQADTGAHLARARSLREQGDLQAARSEVTSALAAYPGDPRLTQFLAGLDQEMRQEPATAVMGTPTAVVEAPPLPGPAPVAIGAKHWLVGTAIGVSAAALFALPFLWNRSGTEQTPTQPGALTLRVETEPEARIFVDGQPQPEGVVKLSPRDQPYSIEARLPGYRSPAPALVTVSKTATALEPVRLTLQPHPTSLLIVSAMNAKLNGQPVSLTEPVQLAPGVHKLELVSATGSALSFDVEARAGRLPLISNLTARALSLASVVTTFASEGHVYVKPAPQTVTIDGGAPQTVTEEGLALHSLAPADHELKFGNTSPQIIAVNDAPAVHVQAAAGEIETGMLSLAIPQEGATVTLQPGNRQLPVRNGRAVAYGLKPGAYTLSISAPGHRAVTEQITIEKGKQLSRKFELTAVERPTALSFAGLPPGTEVIINDQLVGTAGGDGAVALPNIGPGRKQILLRHPRYEGRPITQDLSIGDNVHLSGEASRMVAFGSIRINGAPPGSRISYRPKGSGAYQDAKENPFYVRQGEYDVLIRAENFQDRHVPPMTVFPGKPTETAVTLTALLAPVITKPPVKLTLPPDFQGRINLDKSGWHMAKDAKLKPVIESGILQFSAQLKGGVFKKDRARWSLRSASTGQCTEFELTAKQFGSGPCGAENKRMTDHGLGDAANSYRVVVQFLAGGITQTIAASPGGSPKQLDSRAALAGGAEFRFVDLGVRSFDFTGQVK